MMRTKVTIGVMTVGVLAAAAGAASAPPVRVTRGASPAQYIEIPGVREFSGTLIVRPRQDLTAVQRDAAIAELDGLVLRSYAEVDEFTVRAAQRGTGQAGEAENALSAALMATGLFQYAVPNWKVYPNNTPNDPFYASQWHHPQMQSALGWDTSVGSSDIITAYTDTGIDTAHPDLAPKRVFGYDAWNNIAEADGGSVYELHGHGTHVAGCGAAIGNNAEGVAGVNWLAKIMMIRVAVDSSGGAYYEDLMEGARWAIEHGAKTASASYSGIGYEPLQTTGAYIKSIGGLYFYAAGNDGQNLNWFDFPDVIVVGASSYNDDPAWFTAYGLGVDCFAPGVDILSSTWGSGYGYASGTSMATPVANGVASMIWSVNPNLTPQAVEDLLYASCDDLGTAGEDDFWGHGRVNVRKAVEMAAATLCPADWNNDGTVDAFDYDDFVSEFFDYVLNGNGFPDFNEDGTVDAFDYDDFVSTFFVPC